MNPLTDDEHHRLSELRDLVLQGVALGKQFAAAHRGLVPPGWIRNYVDTRVRHAINRYNLLVGGHRAGERYTIGM